MIKRLSFLALAIVLALVFVTLVQAAELLAVPANDDLPTKIGQKCESFMEYTAQIPGQPGRANRYSIDLPYDIVACWGETEADGTTYYHGNGTMHGGGCLNGFCMDGLGMFKDYNNGQVSFWWESEQPDSVTIYYRKRIPGESAPTLTPTPTPTPVVTDPPPLPPPGLTPLPPDLVRAWLYMPVIR